MTPGLDFGVAFANVGPNASAEAAIRLAVAAEAAGFESLWTADHVVVPAGYRSIYPYDPTGRLPSEEVAFPDPLVWMAFVAARTTTLRLGTGILVLPQRNPLVLAKQVATLDHLADRRVILGVGLGWLREEFDALGVPFDGRGGRADEAVGAMRALWSEGRATFHGETVAFDDCVLRPRPPAGAVPVHVGGHTEAAARRAGRLGDGFFPFGVDRQRLGALVTTMRRSAEEAGRDPSSLEVTVGATCRGGEEAVDEARALRALGATRVLVPAAFFGDDPRGPLAAYASGVIERSGA
ncbi:MAG: LLM class F420-dependent oxidoreductase [Acidimicrobiales bacterium]